jgi:hypothetical protein
LAVIKIATLARDSETHEIPSYACRSPSSPLIFSLVLIPIVILLLLGFRPGRLHDDTLRWILVFFWPVLLALVLSISFTVGFAAFVVAVARLPGWPWRSAQTLVIVLPSAAIVLAATATGWRFYSMTHPPQITRQQKGLPTLQLARTLTARDRSSHVVVERRRRLVTYTGAEILTISP